MKYKNTFPIKIENLSSLDVAERVAIGAEWYLEHVDGSGSISLTCDETYTYFNEVKNEEVTSHYRFKCSRAVLNNFFKRVD